MLQRAASNAYSWWWASHIRTNQSKWLDANLQDMENRVKIMLKLLGEEADSFATRAEMYYRRRPEVISHVEVLYRSYRALVERYDHISKELHKANHTIATAFPEEVQYAMLEEEDENFPKAITPIDSRKIHKPTIDEILKKKRESLSAKNGRQHERFTSPMSKENAEEETSRLQKAILVLQTEKEFVKSSYENGIAKYWEIENQMADMQEEICRIQDSYNANVLIEDDEARALMTATALKSCEGIVTKLQKQYEELIKLARIESERIKSFRKKLKTIKGNHRQSPTETVVISDEGKDIGTADVKTEGRVYSVNQVMLDLQPICERIEKFFEIYSDSSVEEMVEKVDELVDKVVNLELRFPKQTAQINQLKGENSDLEKKLDELQDEMILRDDPSDLTDSLKQVEEELHRVKVLERSIHDEVVVMTKTFAEVFSCLTNISKNFESPNPDDQVSFSSLAKKGETILSDHELPGEINQCAALHDDKESFLAEEFSDKESPKVADQIHLIGSENVRILNTRDDCAEKVSSEEAAQSFSLSVDQIPDEEFGDKIPPNTVESLKAVDQIHLIGSESINNLTKRDECGKKDPSEEVAQSSSVSRDQIQEEDFEDKETPKAALKIHIIDSENVDNFEKKDECGEDDSLEEVGQSSVDSVDEVHNLKNKEPMEAGSSQAGNYISPMVSDRVLEEIEDLDQRIEQSPRDSQHTDSHISHRGPEKNNDYRRKRRARRAHNARKANLARDHESKFFSIEEATQLGQGDAPSWQELLLDGLEGRESILLAEYTSVLQNYKETKRRLAELEKKNQQHLDDTMAVIRELRNANSLKYVEIQSLKHRLDSSEMPQGDSTSNVERTSSIRSHKEGPAANDVMDGGISEVEGADLNHANGPKNASLFEEKFRREIDVLLEENFQFLLRYGTSSHRTQELEGKCQELQGEMEKLQDESTEEFSNGAMTDDQLVSQQSEPAEKQLRALKTDLEVWFEQNALLRQELQLKISSLSSTQEEIAEALRTGSNAEGAQFTPCEAARFQGEVLNMQQMYNKIEIELQAALDYMRGVRTKVEEALQKLCESFELSSRSETERNFQNQFKHFPSRTRVPLRNFLFGDKPKKKSFFACMNPMLHKQYSDL